jgi:hypothetical protein
MFVTCITHSIREEFHFSKVSYPALNKFPGRAMQRASTGKGNSGFPPLLLDMREI